MHVVWFLLILYAHLRLAGALLRIVLTLRPQTEEDSNSRISMVHTAARWEQSGSCIYFIGFSRELIHISSTYSLVAKVSQWVLSDIKGDVQPAMYLG